MIRRVMEWLFPRKCILCRSLLSKEETDLCRKCRVEQPEYRYGKKKIPHVSDLTAVWMYQGQVRRSLHRYKFGNARHYAAPYGRLLAMRIARDLPRADIVTWVPISAKRRRKRGFDQVELLTKAVSPELGIPAEKLLDKFRDNRANSGLKTPAERRANVLGVYRAVGQEHFRGKRVLLLDDVVTTGATASECARVLLTAGAEEVLFAAVAAAGTTSSK
ncbi:MAG: ComF family protein [Ruminococcaceae bacterium]|nr:ComF family protein [Oscillospiraceae bacterium]